MPVTSPIPLKRRLFDLCVDYVEQRISTSKQAIKAAQVSANEETKSSSGDKYETGRAMAQLEIEKNSTQLAEAQRLKQQLLTMNLELSSSTVQPGSLVITNQGNFFISIPAGQLTVDGVIYFAVSPASPIASQLLGLKKGSQFTFNKKLYAIESLH